MASRLGRGTPVGDRFPRADSFSTPGRIDPGVGRYADRLSINIELPSQPALQALAPEEARFQAWLAQLAGAGSAFEAPAG